MTDHKQHLMRVQGVPRVPVPRVPVWRRKGGAMGIACVAIMAAAAIAAWGAETPEPEVTEASAATSASAPSSPAPIPEPTHVGGEPDGVVQVANVVYAGVKSSHCFSDHFLVEAERVTAISTSRRFHAVKLADQDVYGYPLLIMTGEGDFTLTQEERENLKRYVERGGFLLASAGCSSLEWDRAFRREMAAVFTEESLKSLAMDHPVFHTATDIDTLTARHGTPRPLEGITSGGRLVVLYSQDGLNDTAHTQGCCCCGGNEITNAIDVNVNVLAYALTY